MRLLLPLLLSLILLITTVITDEADQQDLDYDATADDAGVIPFTHFCNFALPMLNHSTADDDDFCDCDVISSPVVGHLQVKIDCEMSIHVTNLTNKVFQAQNLPAHTVKLILTYQHFREVPEFIGEHLKHLDMSNNLITIIKDDNFIQVTSMEHLDLSYNSISVIQSNAFKQLQLLHHLDLSSNRLTALPSQVFAPLVTLETLKLSSNVGLGRDLSIYQHYGITSMLNSLAMTHCAMTSIDLRDGTGLKRIDLGFNNISDFTLIGLPWMVVESLDLSGNTIFKMTNKSLPTLLSLEELVLEDMPHLMEVSGFSLHSFPKLRNLTLEGSKSLTQFKIDNSSYENVDVQLRIVNLRGCAVRSLDETLLSIVSHLDEFHLEGNPLDCDCKIKWLKQVKADTRAQCYRPELLKEKLLSDVPDSKLKCDNFFVNRLVNTLILLFLLVTCSLTIWFFLRRLNPTRRNKFQKVGPESPYQRVTIEPNRAEYSLY